MSKKNHHIFPQGNNFLGKEARNTNVTKIVSTHIEAIKTAKNIVINQGSELIIHRPNGQIREKNSYAKDNYPSKG